MKREFGYGIAAGVLFCVSLVCQACVNEETANAIESQKSAIVSYLDSQNLEYTIVGETYKYVAGNNSSVADPPVSVNGDLISFYFEAYVFNRTPATKWFYTNKQGLIEKDTLLNATYWSTDPMQVKIGAGSRIKGVDNALSDCREGDSVVLFLPSSQAYGEKDLGVIPKNTALMYILNIVEINKQ